MIFHLRPCLLKLDDNFLKHSSLGISSDQVSQNIVRKQNKNMAHENVLQTYNQCIKIFKMSYQRLLYALFRPPDPDPD